MMREYNMAVKSKSHIVMLLPESYPGSQMGLQWTPLKRQVTAHILYSYHIRN